MTVLPSDLTSHARVRNAALHAFARDGVAATTIRGVASDAGVSVGVVQHHFPTKRALREAVDSYVVTVAEAAFADLGEWASPEDAVDRLGDRVVSFVSEHSAAITYVARGAIDGDEAALAVFDAFVAIAGAQWRGLAADQILHEDLDLSWAALHTTVINVGGVLFAAALSRHLPEAFLSPDGLERWKTATTAMFKRGLYRPAAAGVNPATPLRKRPRDEG